MNYHDEEDTPMQDRAHPLACLIVAVGGSVLCWWALIYAVKKGLGL
jgi:hypothetical protein